ncbi:MAG TPA: ABC transporter permease [Bacteroidales bacterium]|nr:ABC transporter permease [Bacteroidales bacterium]HRT90721.1 ABC transporter permease [Bacteroidales bacterium]
MKISFTNKLKYAGLASVIVMLVAWKLLSLYFDSAFILPSPEKTLITTLKLFTDGKFLLTVGSTVLRSLTGFLLSALLGILTGIASGTNPHFDAFLRPVLVVIRSTPVIAIILLALIWLNPGMVPVFIAFLTMFPFICTNVSDGIKSVDNDLVMMARFYRVGNNRIVRELYIPAIMPFIISGASSAMGIGWRAIITGEVLSHPKYGIGTLMHNAQTFLNVDAVIAWTIIAVIISYLFEKAIRWSERKLIKWRASA